MLGTEFGIGFGNRTRSIRYIYHHRLSKRSVFDITAKNLVGRPMK